MVDTVRRQLRDTPGQFERGRVAELERCRVVQLQQLLMHRVGNLTAPVTSGNAEQPG